MQYYNIILRIEKFFNKLNYRILVYYLKITFTQGQGVFLKTLHIEVLSLIFSQVPSNKKVILSSLLIIDII